MWRFLGVTYICFTTVSAYGIDNFVFPNVIDILNYESSTNISETCRKHLNHVLERLSGPKKDLRALKMIDSITKFPDGVLMGHFTIPGQFDECVNVTFKEFVGKHCMTKLSVKLNQDNLYSLNTTSTSKEDQILTFTYGLCVPSTCSSTDIETLFNNQSILPITVRLNETNCSTKAFRPFRTEDWVTVAILVVIIATAFGSTVYDLYQRKKKKNETPHELWSSFSLYSNGKHLFNISQSTAQLKCLHGIRFFSMCWVILGHSYFTMLLGSPVNIFELSEFMNDKSFIPVSNAYVSVDSFFFLSGLLVCLVFFRDILKKKSFDVPVAFIHRYMRLTPPFAILMLIQATIISRLGNGPFWNSGSDTTEKNCRESWWMGLLYVQNYLRPTSLCLGQAWYLSADMQMFWVSPLILYSLLWFPAFAPYILTLLVLTAAFTNFAVTYVHELGPNLLMTWGGNRLKQFETEYAPFHTRMAPYIIGLATGYIICGIQAKKIRLNMSKLWAVAGWAIAAALLGSSLFGLSFFLNKAPHSQTESSFYLAFHRVGWALGLAWIVIACVGGYGSIINYILSLDCFQPLGKLAYCNFLIHMTLQNFRINSSRVSPYVRHFEVVYVYFGDILISNLLSVPISLLFEFPFIKVDRFFFRNLEIFPFPKPKKEIENKVREEKSEKLAENTKNLEEGKVNSSFDPL